MIQDPEFFKEILMKNDRELLTALLKNDGTFSFLPSFQHNSIILL